MTRLSAMLEEAGGQARPALSAAPVGPSGSSTRLSGLLERTGSVEVDAGKQFDDAFDLAAELGAPLGTV